MTASDTILNLFVKNGGNITMAEIRGMLPDMSKGTINSAMSRMLNERIIAHAGKRGHYKLTAKGTKNGEANAASTELVGPVRKRRARLPTFKLANALVLEDAEGNLYLAERIPTRG